MAYEGALAALADPTRRAVFETVAARPRPVGEIADELPVTRPAVSQHLQVLERAGLVRGKAAGNRRVYRVDPRGLADLRSYVDSFWDQALEAYKQTAESRGEGGDE